MPSQKIITYGASVVWDPDGDNEDLGNDMKSINLPFTREQLGSDYVGSFTKRIQLGMFDFLGVQFTLDQRENMGTFSIFQAAWRAGEDKVLRIVWDSLNPVGPTNLQWDYHGKIKDLPMGAVLVSCKKSPCPFLAGWSPTMTEPTRSTSQPASRRPNNSEGYRHGISRPPALIFLKLRLRPGLVGTSEALFHKRRLLKCSKLFTI